MVSLHLSLMLINVFKFFELCRREESCWFTSSLLMLLLFGSSKSFMRKSCDERMTFYSR